LTKSPHSDSTLTLNPKPTRSTTTEKSQTHNHEQHQTLDSPQTTNHSQKNKQHYHHPKPTQQTPQNPPPKQSHDQKENLPKHQHQQTHQNNAQQTLNPKTNHHTTDAHKTQPQKSQLQREGPTSKIQKLCKKQNTAKNKKKTDPLTAAATPLTTLLSSATLWPLLLTPTPTSHHTQPDHTFTKHFMKLSQHTTHQHSLTL